MRTRSIAAALGVTATLTLASAAPAMAFQTPTTGQPGASNGVTCQTQPSSPGNAASNNGSAFSPTGQAGNVYAGNTGTASAAHANSGAAVSQYDVACLRVSSH